MTAHLADAGVYTGLQWFISVAGELDKGTVTLAVLNLHHPLVSRQALVQLLHSHYMRAALPKLLKIMGHANVLGNRDVHMVVHVTHVMVHVIQDRRSCQRLFVRCTQHNSILCEKATAAGCCIPAPFDLLDCKVSPSIHVVNAYALRLPYDQRSNHLRCFLTRTLMLHPGSRSQAVH